VSKQPDMCFDASVNETADVAFNQPRAVDIVSDISYRSFIEEYAKPCLPVIIRGGLQELPASQWTPELMQQRWGDKEFDIDGEPHKFGDIIAQIQASTPENPGPYFRSVDVATEFPELISDLAPGIMYAWPNYRYMKSLFPRWYFPDDGRFAEMFFGGSGSNFPFGHADYPPMHTFIGLFFGEKEWILFGPDQREKLYIKDNQWTHSNVDNLFEPDLEKYPKLKHARPYRAVQQAGDIFFMPCNWIHTARNHSPAMSVSWDQLSHSCWDQFISNKYNSLSDRHPVKSRLVNLYLRGLGGVLGVGESIVRRVGNQPYKGRVV
jgi:histone arginine demethylase JMJD6